MRVRASWCSKVGSVSFRTAREHNAELGAVAPWQGFNKWAKCVRAMVNYGEITPSQAGEHIKALPCYREGLDADELAAIDDAVKRIELEQSRSVVLWSRQRPWILRR